MLGVERHDGNHTAQNILEKSRFVYKRGINLSLEEEMS